VSRAKPSIGTTRRCSSPTTKRPTRRFVQRIAPGGTSENVQQCGRGDRSDASAISPAPQSLGSVLSTFNYHATLLHLFGLDDTKLVYHHNGQEERITNTKPCQVVKEILRNA